MREEPQPGVSGCVFAYGGYLIVYDFRAGLTDACVLIFVVFQTSAAARAGGAGQVGITVAAPKLCCTGFTYVYFSVGSFIFITTVNESILFKLCQAAVTVSADGSDVLILAFLTHDFFR